MSNLLKAPSEGPPPCLREVPLRGLIVEDQALIGLALEAYLEELGIEVCGLFVSEAEALAYLAGNTPDFAILDYTLKAGPCSGLARFLRDRGVPVIVYSGHAWREGMPIEFKDLPWIEKPAPRAAIVAAILRHVPAAGARASQLDPAGGEATAS